MYSFDDEKTHIYLFRFKKNKNIFFLPDIQ